MNDHCNRYGVRESNELAKNKPLYEVLIEVLKPVFEYASDVVSPLRFSPSPPNSSPQATQFRQFWPEEYKRHAEGLAANLADIFHCPLHPHTSFVLNINAITHGHRDDKDAGSCIVIPVFLLDGMIGGELVLEELGIIINFMPGDILLFKSKHISHYNLHFKGVRLSLVIQSDGTAGYWNHAKGGWEYMVQTGNTGPE